MTDDGTFQLKPNKTEDEGDETERILDIGELSCVDQAIFGNILKMVSFELRVSLKQLSSDWLWNRQWFYKQHDLGTRMASR